jgi:hypothetical protein
MHGVDAVILPNATTSKAPGGEPRLTNGGVLVKRLRAHTGIIALLTFGLLWSWPALAAPEQKYVVKPVAQKKIKDLPAGALYWRVEQFPTLADAEAAVGPDGWNPASVQYETTTSLIGEVAGSVWVATLGPKGGSTPGGTTVAEIGPVPRVAASEYLLRLNYGSGPAGSRTPVHSHLGSESFYVISGRLGSENSRGRQLCRRGPRDEWTCRRNHDGSFQRRQNGFECPDHVRRRCEQAILGACHFRVRSSGSTVLDWQRYPCIPIAS